METIVERFVREHCPLRDMRGFSPAELALLNAGRRSQTTFAPYESRAP